MNGFASQTAAQDDTLWVSEHFKENYAMLAAIGRLFIGSSPEQLDMIDDEIQEVFVSLWKKRDTLRAHPNIDAWLVEALRRQLLGRVSRAARRQRKFSLHSYDDPEREDTLSHLEQSAYPNPADMLEGKERYALLVSVLGQENAAIFYAYCVMNYSARDLAAQYGCSEACIWTRISRSKKRILACTELFFMMMLAFVLRV